MAGLHTGRISDSVVPCQIYGATVPVLCEATRRRFCDAPRHVILGDGALWIWSIPQELFPDAIQIVDRFHVQQTLHRTAQAIFGSTAQPANKANNGQQRVA